MKNLFIIMLIAGSVYQIWGKYSHSLTKLQPIYNQPYIVVYGRNTCGFTTNTLKELKHSGVGFTYKNVDDKAVADALHSRMNSSGIDTRRYNLPVVDVNNTLSIRPQPTEIINAYRSVKL
jgi:hypothetical protein